MARLTLKNHTVHPDQRGTYRIPTSRVGEFSLKTFGNTTAYYGDIIDKLGKYEDMGEPEELAKKLNKYF